MKPIVKRRLCAALLLLLPLALFLVIREQQSWRPRVLGQMKFGITALAWSPDGKSLACARGSYEGQGGDILLWDVKTGTKRRWQLEQGDGTYRFWFLQDNKLACQTYSNKLLVYDARRGAAWSRPQFIKVEGKVAISPDGRQIIYQVVDYKSMAPGYFALRDLSSHEIVKLTSPDTRSMAINHIAFAPDGKRFAACLYNSPRYRDPTVWLWNLEAPQIPHVFRLARDSHPGAELTFWPNSASIAGTSLGQLFVVDITSGQVKTYWRGKEGLLALSPDGEMVARHDFNSVSLYKYPSMTLMRQLPMRDNRFDVGSMAFSPDGRTLAIGDYQGFVTLWRVK